VKNQDMRVLSCRICSGIDAPINLFDPENGHLIRQILSITGVEVKAKNIFINQGPYLFRYL